MRRGDKRGTHVGLAIDLGLGLFVAEHVALTVRGALITGVLGLGSITAGAEVVF